jgi:hypothetical protein
MKCGDYEMADDEPIAPRLLNPGNMKSLEYLNAVQGQMVAFMAPSFFGLRRRSAREISEFCDILSQARNILWQGVYVQFPESRSGQWMVTATGEVKEVGK